MAFSTIIIIMLEHIGLRLIQQPGIHCPIYSHNVYVLCFQALGCSDDVTAFRTINAAALPLIILVWFGLLNYTQDVLCLGLNRPFLSACV